MRNDDIRKIIDGVLRANKTLVGTSSWQEDRDGESWRWLASVEINDEQRGITLVIKYYPGQEYLKFSVTLNLQRCFWRLDFTKTEHLNPLQAPYLGGSLIRGPHYHPWSDNRMFAKANSLPKRLRNARLLPESFQGFHPALRWFFDETNIYVEAGDMPDLPKRITLL